MKPPRFTDNHRFPPGGYRSAAHTNVAETFERIRAEQAKNAAEAQAKVARIQRKK